MASWTEPGERPRVCILAKSTPFIWVHHYVNAFRRMCDVVTAGPMLSSDDLAASEREHLAHLVVPNDINGEIDGVETLADRLPAGWAPDLVVAIQSGMAPVPDIARLGCPTAYISVDTWHDCTEFNYARPYDAVFVAQRAYVRRFVEAGARSAYWLPLACDPRAHFPVPCDPDFDIAFVGAIERAVHTTRAARLARLAERFSVLAATAVDTDTMSKAYARARLGFNSSVARDVNMRVFEVMAMGVPLLANRDAAANGLLDLFEEDRHFIGYDDADLLERAQYGLADARTRQRIATAARDAVLANHTYDHRVRSILDTVAEVRNGHALRRRALLRGHSALAEYLPLAAGRTGDMYAGAGVSKVAVRQWGATAFVALAHDPDAACIRASSFDEVAAVHAAPAESFDTLLFRPPSPEAFQPGLSRSTELLRSGGTLVLALSPSVARRVSADLDPAAVWAYVESVGFSVIRMDAIAAESLRDTAFVVVARRCGRAVHDIAREMYAEDPMPGLDINTVFPTSNRAV